MDASGWAIFGSLLVVLVMIVILIVVCIKFCRPSKRRRFDEDAPSLSTDQLIPPIFMYTDGMKDPLYQADLCERVKTEKKTKS